MTVYALPDAFFDIVVFGKSCYVRAALAAYGEAPLDGASRLLTPFRHCL
jgi:hypothetical protein